MKNIDSSDCFLFIYTQAMTNVEIKTRMILNTEFRFFYNFYLNTTKFYAKDA